MQLWKGLRRIAVLNRHLEHKKVGEAAEGEIRKLFPTDSSTFRIRNSKVLEVLEVFDNDFRGDACDMNIENISAFAR